MNDPKNSINVNFNNAACNQKDSLKYLNKKESSINLSNLDIASASLIAASTSSAVASATMLATSLSRLSLDNKDE